MLPLEQRRLDRALRKAVNDAVNSGNALAANEASPAAAALDAAEAADEAGDRYALAGIGRIGWRWPVVP